jgi:hypothetical protein
MVFLVIFCIRMRKITSADILFITCVECDFNLKYNKQPHYRCDYRNIFYLPIQANHTLEYSR